MSVIYEPKGRAKEYCELALNLYKGCQHGCSYCYVPAFTRQSRKTFHNNISARDKIIEKLRNEAPKYSGREVLLSFTSDPYQHLDEELKLTRQAMEILNGNDIAVNILTKAGTRSMRDFDILSLNKGNKYGATLTFISNDASMSYEPFAATPDERICVLETAKEMGIQTWVSLEPVIYPSQTLEIIKKTIGIVDEYKVGKWNHDKRADEIDWKKFLRDAVDLFNKYNQKYYIKEDLRKAGYAI